MSERPPKFYKNPSIAVVLSFFWPGLGQIYNGEIGKGILFLIAAGVSAGLMWVLIGFYLYSAANSKLIRLAEEWASTMPQIQTTG